MVDSAFQKAMLGTSPPTNWSQISAEIPLSLVIMSQKVWDSGENGMEEKGGGSQMFVTYSVSPYGSAHMMYLLLLHLCRPACIYYTPPLAPLTGQLICSSPYTFHSAGPLIYTYTCTSANSAGPLISNLPSQHVSAGLLNHSMLSPDAF